MSKTLADQLGLKSERVEELKIVEFGSSNSKLVKTYLTTLSLKLNNGEYLPIKAVISGDLQRKKTDVSSVKNLDYLIRSLDLADTFAKENGSASIDLLIDNDYYLDLRRSQNTEAASGLYFLSSKLGWIPAKHKSTKKTVIFPTC